MKEVHLICNAHLDPIWQWEWEEGAAAALSTFQAAADLADSFDYIFCHNEVSLYKYIEEYAPSLFSRIRELIRIGKWHVMGGWYLQPDCNMPSGESFVRQIQVGHRYFREKFGVNPTTAICFDAFGHTRGLVQIVKKCGQDSYICCRTGSDPIPDTQFWWEGFDGSRIQVNAAVHGYNSPLGGAADNILSKANAQDKDVVCVLWGVGNHGGGPSRKDLADIDKLMAEGSMQILHSTPEYFFARIHPEAIHDRSMEAWAIGCYTTQVRVKQKHAALENQLWITEKMCSAASLRGRMEYPEEELNQVVEDLLNSEFHDILPGSTIRAGEENGLQILEHGLFILNHLRARAFFAMSAGEPRAADGEYPILVFHPQCTEEECEILCEFSLADQNWSETHRSQIRILDADGNECPVQVIKEESNIPLDWRKRVIFRGRLAPLSLTRFSLYVDFVPKESAQPLPVCQDVIVDVPGKHVEIDGKTGLLRSYQIDGVEYLRGGACQPVFYDDDEDPWCMRHTTLGANPRPIPLMTHPDGVFEGMQPVQVIEDGPIYTGVECFFAAENTKIRVEYDIYKHTPAIDIQVDVFLGDRNRMIKLALPCGVSGSYIGQTAFGVNPLYMDGRECVAGRYVALRREDGTCLTLCNRGTYGSSFLDGILSMTLVRGATYCAHPIGDRPILPANKFIKKIDMGERNFAFRLNVVQEDGLEAAADHFNAPPYALNVFPVATPAPENTPFSLSISSPAITLVTLKKRDGGTTYLLRLLNNTSHERDCTVAMNATVLSFHFGAYEVKTVEYDGSALLERQTLLI